MVEIRQTLFTPHSVISIEIHCYPHPCPKENYNSGAKVLVSLLGARVQETPFFLFAFSTRKQINPVRGIYER